MTRPVEAEEGRKAAIFGILAITFGSGYLLEGLFPDLDDRIVPGKAWSGLAMILFGAFLIAASRGEIDKMRDLVVRRQSLALGWRLGAYSFWLLALAALVLARLLSAGGFSMILLPLALCYVLAMLGAACQRRSDRLGALTAAELLARDPRPRILYLRSFADEQSGTSRHLFLPGPVWDPDFWADRRTISFEEGLCRGLASVGPVVALGRPGESLPPLGAARLYVESGHWQQVFEEQSRESRLFCLLIGDSEGLLWEFETLVRTRHPSQVLLIVPYAFGLRWVEAWRGFATQVNERLGWSLPTQPPDAPIAVRFDPGWTPVFLSGEADADCYEKLLRHKDLEYLRSPRET